MNRKKPTPKYTAEFRERGVRLYREQRSDYTSDNAAYRAIASKLVLPLAFSLRLDFGHAHDVGARRRRVAERLARTIGPMTSTSAS